MFRPKKKYKLIERRVQRPGPVLLVANQQLHSYNMQHNPDYRNNYIQDKVDRNNNNYIQDKMDRHKEQDIEYYDNSSPFNYGLHDNTFGNSNKFGTNEDNDNNEDNLSQSNIIRRPTPTKFNDLSSQKKYYHQNSEKSKVKNNNSGGSPFISRDFSFQESYRPYSHDYLSYREKKKTVSGSSPSFPHFPRGGGAEDDGWRGEDSQSDYSDGDDTAPGTANTPRPAFTRFQVQRHDDELGHGYHQDTYQDDADYQDGVQRGFHTFDPHGVGSAGGSQETPHQASQRPYHTTQKPYQSSQRPYQVSKMPYQSTATTRRRPYRHVSQAQYQYTKAGGRYHGNQIQEPGNTLGNTLGNTGIRSRNFFPKTNERQPLVDVKGFGPSFTTTFFDSLDLHRY